MKIKRFFLSALVVALLQSGALYAMIEKHAMTLRHGTLITLTTQPVDPRDLLRGEYVRLGYGISSVAESKITGNKPDWRGLVDIYVTVKEGAEGRWNFAGASWQKRTDLAAGEIQIHGRTLNQFYVAATGVMAGDGVFTIQYGIERYFLPEGWGRAIEKVQSEHGVDAVIAVSEAGDAQIRALKYNGRLLYQEPAY